LRSELDPDLQSLVQRLPSSKIAKVNLSSIAAATAINRETVRRKVNNLEKMGWVLRDKDGIRMVPGVISYEVLRKIIGAQLDALTGAANQLVKLGVLTSKQRRGWTFAKP
jgi:DNA-binding IclR family transcriptional regulator